MADERQHDHDRDAHDGERTHKRPARPNHRIRTQTVDETQQRAQFGGFNGGAAFYGWLVAVAISVLLLALISAGGTVIALTTNTAIEDLGQQPEAVQTIGLVGGILLALALTLAYFAGGYVAGRMSRFDGGRQGAGVWVIGLLAIIASALLGTVLGAQYNLLQQINLPNIPVNGVTYSDGGILALIVTLLLTLMAAIAGGRVGEGYHHKVDRAGRIS
ncbi:hypothetical protein JNJ66_01435 [Candidatus Saccharibacteria bacterium]|nr:hypothetical protein [Candidatus Saccharibacteria bacterium]